MLPMLKNDMTLQSVDFLEEVRCVHSAMSRSTKARNNVIVPEDNVLWIGDNTIGCKSLQF